MRRKKANCFSNKYFEFRGRWKGGGDRILQTKTGCRLFPLTVFLGGKAFFFLPVAHTG